MQGPWEKYGGAPAQTAPQAPGVIMGRPKAPDPYKVQQDLQESMQALVGIVRTESEMQEALGRLAALRERAGRAGVEGHREYHTGWHTCLDLRNLLDVSEAITRAALERLSLIHI